MTEAKIGDTCKRCGERVRRVSAPNRTLGSAFTPTIEQLACGCGFAAPLVGDDEDS
jgi:hypothetical protein